jgi:BioD-like phosphotransacetylase family protein
MQLKKVPLQLYKDTQTALKDICRYDDLERYVLMQILTAAEKHQRIEEVFIKCARSVFKRHPLTKTKVAV